MRYLDLARFVRVPSTLRTLAFLAIAAATARAQTPVHFGDTIDQPGLYVLAGNQTGFGVGVTIESDDVTLFLLRFTLRGQGPQIGITSNGFDRVRIYGGRVTGFRFGISLFDGEDCTVKDTRLDHNFDSGLILRNVRESAFLRLTCDSNDGFGVTALDCRGDRFVSVLAHHNAFDGILVESQTAASEANRVRSCWLAYNGDNGVRLRNASDNDVTENECVANGLVGIQLERVGMGLSAMGAFDTRDNDVSRNLCVFNRQGILVNFAAHSNTLHENIALANTDHDLVDENPEPPCANLWFLDTFLTRDGAGEDCIF